MAALVAIWNHPADRNIQEYHMAIVRDLHACVRVSVVLRHRGVILVVDAPGQLFVDEQRSTSIL
jgi:hypothetical protein